jgi:hypothetical protein
MSEQLFAYMLWQTMCRKTHEKKIFYENKIINSKHLKY